MDDPGSITDIRRAEAENELFTSEACSDLLTLLDREFDVLLAGLELADKSRAKDLDGDYMFVYSALGTKILSNMVSAVSLLRKGRYGDSLVLLRVGIGGVNTLQFLAAYDEHVADWLAPQDKILPPEEKRRIFHIFEDKNIRKKLEAKDLPPMTDAYRAISESVHSSLIGMQVYAQEIYGGRIAHRIQPLPTFDPMRAMGVAVALTGLLSGLLDTLWNRYLDVIGDTEDWQDFAYLWKPLHAEVAETGTRLKEEVETVLRDLRNGGV